MDQQRGHRGLVLSAAVPSPSAQARVSVSLLIDMKTPGITVYAQADDRRPRFLRGLFEDGAGGSTRSARRAPAGTLRASSRTSAAPCGRSSNNGRSGAAPVPIRNCANIRAHRALDVRRCASDWRRPTSSRVLRLGLPQLTVAAHGHPAPSSPRRSWAARPTSGRRIWRRRSWFLRCAARGAALGSGSVPGQFL